MVFGSGLNPNLLLSGGWMYFWLMISTRTTHG